MPVELFSLPVSVINRYISEDRLLNLTQSRSALPSKSWVPLRGFSCSWGSNSLLNVPSSPKFCFPPRRSFGQRSWFPPSRCSRPWGLDSLLMFLWLWCPSLLEVMVSSLSPSPSRAESFFEVLIHSSKPSFVLKVLIPYQGSLSLMVLIPSSRWTLARLILILSSKYLALVRLSS